MRVDTETSQTLDGGLRALSLIADSGSRGMSVSELATGLDVDLETVSKVVTTLVQHDLVRRFADGQI